MKTEYNHTKTDQLAVAIAKALGIPLPIKELALNFGVGKLATVTVVTYTAVEGDPNMLAEKFEQFTLTPAEATGDEA